MQAAMERSDKLVHLITFTLGQTMYGIPLLDVREITSYEKVSPMSTLPNYALGELALRDQLIPVLNLKMLFDIGQFAPTVDSRVIVIENASKCYGLGVDHVNTVIALPESFIEKPSPLMFSAGRKDVFAGIGKTESSLIVILKVAHLLMETEIKELAKKSKPKKAK